MLSFTRQDGSSGFVGQQQQHQQQKKNELRMKASRIPLPSPIKTTKKLNEHEKLMKQQEQQQQHQIDGVGTTTPTRHEQQKPSTPSTSTSSTSSSYSPLNDDEEGDDDEQVEEVPVVVDADEYHEEEDGDGEGMVDMTDLLRYMERREWMCVVRFLEQHPRAPYQKTITGNLPLHEALKHHPPLPVISLVLELNPVAAKHIGAHGYLPLHVACLCRTIKADVIGRLVAVYPMALRTRCESQKDGLPLHLAVQTGTSEEVLMELLTHYPEASFIQDMTGKIPLDYANESCHHHNRSIVALETAPILLAAAQAARARTVREYDRKVEGLRDAHSEYTRQLERRFQSERADFVQREIDFADDLTQEKERNIAFAEIVIDMKRVEKSLQKERDALQGRLDEEATEYRSLIETQDRELRTVLEKTIVCHTRSGSLVGPGVQRSNGTRRRSRSAQRSARGDDDGDGDGDIDGVEVLMSHETNKPLGTLLEDLARDYEGVKAENISLMEQLEYKEDMVRHLNELLSSKDEEIPRLNQRVHELEVANGKAKERAMKLEEMHNATLQHLSAVRDEVHQLKQNNHIQQCQLKESRRKVKTQEHRLGNIKSFVTSLNFSMETWLEDEEWRSGVAAAGDGAAVKAMGSKNNSTKEDDDDKDDEDDEDHTYPSTIEDVDTSGHHPSSSSSGSVMEVLDEEGDGQNPKIAKAETPTILNPASFDTVTGTTVVVTHVAQKMDKGSSGGEKDESGRDIHEAISYETATTTPTYMDSYSVGDKSTVWIAETRSVHSNTSVPQLVERSDVEECGQESVSLSVASNISYLHRTITDCGLPSSIISP